jgi:fluoride ion exporter CrcB/FEX
VAAALARASDDGDAPAAAGGGGGEPALEPEEFAAAEAAVAEAAAGLRRPSSSGAAVVRLPSLGRPSLGRTSARSSLGRASPGHWRGYGAAGLPRPGSPRGGGAEANGAPSPRPPPQSQQALEPLPQQAASPPPVTTEVVLLEEDNIYPFGWGVVDAASLLAILALTGTSVWWLIVRREDRSTPFLQTSYAVALLVGPIGCYLRFYLSRFNGSIKGRWSWFPAGTFAANMIACIVNFTVRAYTQQLLAPPPQITEDGLAGLMTGFCGSLSTVSTWVVEVGRPQGAGQPGWSGGDSRGAAESQWGGRRGPSATRGRSRPDAVVAAGVLCKPLDPLQRRPTALLLTPPPLPHPLHPAAPAAAACIPRAAARLRLLAAVYRGVHFPGAVHPGRSHMGRATRHCSGGGTTHGRVTGAGSKHTYGARTRSFWPPPSSLYCPGPSLHALPFNHCPPATQDAAPLSCMPPHYLLQPTFCCLFRSAIRAGLSPLNPLA